MTTPSEAPPNPGASLLLSPSGEIPPNAFPRLLMKLLNDEVAPDALWWLPDGKAFAINPKTVPSKILDIYFRGTKFSSFIRRLHNTGFRRTTRQHRKNPEVNLPDGAITLSHQLFQRDAPELLEDFGKAAQQERPDHLSQLQEAKASSPSPAKPAAVATAGLSAAAGLSSRGSLLAGVGSTAADHQLAASLLSQPLSSSSVASAQLPMLQGRLQQPSALQQALNVSQRRLLDTSTAATNPASLFALREQDRLALETVQPGQQQQQQQQRLLALREHHPSVSSFQSQQQQQQQQMAAAASLTTQGSSLLQRQLFPESSLIRNQLLLQSLAGGGSQQQPPALQQQLQQHSGGGQLVQQQLLQQQQLQRLRQLEMAEQATAARQQQVGDLLLLARARHQGLGGPAAASAAPSGGDDAGDRTGEGSGGPGQTGPSPNNK